MVRGDVAPPLPPVYRVELVAAPAGPRQSGVVRSPAAQPATVPATPLPAIDRVISAPAKAAPRAVEPTRATPAPSTRTVTPPVTAPVAGGGPTGGTGADVATVRTAGIDFPFPGYLTNIVRQIAIRFEPDIESRSRRADVAFTVRRDGSITDLRFVQRSGDYAFDQESQGAVESAARARAFGPLPDGFREDALPVIFSFDPRILR